MISRVTAVQGSASRSRELPTARMRIVLASRITSIPSASGIRFQPKRASSPCAWREQHADGEDRESDHRQRRRRRRTLRQESASGGIGVGFFGSRPSRRPSPTARSIYRHRCEMKLADDGRQPDPVGARQAAAKITLHASSDGDRTLSGLERTKTSRRRRPDHGTPDQMNGRSPRRGSTR